MIDSSGLGDLGGSAFGGGLSAGGLMLLEACCTADAEGSELGPDWVAEDRPGLRFSLPLRGRDGTREVDAELEARMEGRVGEDSRETVETVEGSEESRGI